MSLIKVFFSSLGSIAAIFVLTKIIGNKQMSQLNLFDYVNGITIGSIAAEMATSIDGSFVYPLLAMIIYALGAVLYSFINTKSISFRRNMMGRSVVILKDGKIYRNSLKRVHLDLSEFLVQCRLNGFFDLGEIELALFEPNGGISFLPKAEKRPVNSDDLKLKPSPAEPCINIIIDGKILYNNLKYMGKNEDWLKKQLNAQKIKNISDIFLATLTRSDKLELFVKKDYKPEGDMFQ